MLFFLLHSQYLLSEALSLVPLTLTLHLFNALFVSCTRVHESLRLLFKHALLVLFYRHFLLFFFIQEREHVTLDLLVFKFLILLLVLLDVDLGI